MTLDSELDWVVVNGTVGFHLREVYRREVERERGNEREWDEEELEREKGRGKGEQGEKEMKTDRKRG